MIVQIPYSLDELVATGQFLMRRRRAGQSLLRVFFTGDTDEGASDRPTPEFERSAGAVTREMLSGGVNVPWNLALCALIGIFLMLTRLALDAQGGMANADHLVGALVITFSACACAEVGRPLRFINIPLGAALLVTPHVYEASMAQVLVSTACGLALIVLSLRRGPVLQRYGSWKRFIF
jgi:hypothetical protein